MPQSPLDSDEEKICLGRHSRVNGDNPAVYWQSKYVD
jgi:hypothetical protein